MALSRQPSDLKSRVITCLNKLSDRDTLSLASSELESIARGLSNDNIAPFLTCLSTTDSTEKSPVRRQCVRLITVLSAAHGDALSPYVSKLLSAVLRRLRDPDSAVRSACVEAVSSISSHVNKPPFYSSILKPLLDCLFHEQDHNAQIGASLCLAAAVEAAPEQDTAELKKMLPRLFKLAKNDSFKAKPSLLSLIGSIVSIGAASSKNMLNRLVPSIVEFLSSEDWAARKAAAEALVKLAAAERDILAEHKSSCLASLESRKFDKVKVVRETMLRALEMWKKIPEASGPQLQSKSFAIDYTTSDASSSDYSPDAPESPYDSGYATPQPRKTVATPRSPTSSTSIGSSQSRGILRIDPGNVSASRSSSKVEFKKFYGSEFEVNMQQAASSKVGHIISQRTEDILNSNLSDSKNSCNSKLEAKCALFHKSHIVHNLRFRSRVVPVCDDDNLEVNVAEGDIYASEDYFGSRKEFEDISLIRKQLIQIENQQSILFELLQRFIGCSQRGINSLEKRVSGLEKALDEMSHDLVISTQQGLDSNSEGNTRCMLSGSEFLSPKFWRKTEGKDSNLIFLSSNKSQSMSTMHNISCKDSNSETTKLENRRNHHLSSNSAKVSMRDDISRHWQSSITGFV